MTREHFQADAQQPGPYDVYEGSIVRMLIDRVSHPITSVRNNITDRLGAFSAAMADATVSYADEECPAEPSLWRHPIRGAREFVEEFIGALEYEADDEAWMVEDHHVQLDRPSAERRSWVQNFAEGLGITTMRNPDQ